MCKCENGNSLWGKKSVEGRKVEKNIKKGKKKQSNKVKIAERCENSSSVKKHK